MAAIVARFGLADVPSLARLLVEMQTHYGVPAPPLVEVEQRLSPPPPGVEILVVRREGEIAGFASFAELYPGGGLASILYLKELYVGAGARRSGIAGALLRRLAAIATERGCRWVDWGTEIDNDTARTFYEGIGAELLTKKIAYRLRGDALAAMAASADEDG